MGIKYVVDNKERFSTINDAVSYVYNRFAKENLNALKIKTVKSIKPEGFMRSIGEEILHVITIIRPATIKRKI